MHYDVVGEAKTMGNKIAHKKFSGIIRKWILLSVICFVLMTLVPITLNSYDVSRKQSIDQMEQLMMVEQAYIDNWLTEKFRAIKTFSTMFSSSAAISTRQPNNGSMSGGFKGSGVADRNGDVLLCTLPNCPSNVSGMPLFSHTKSGIWYSDELEINPATGERLMLVSSPVMDKEGKFDGVVFARIGFSNIELMMEKFGRKSNLSIYLVNEQGKWVAGSEKSDVSHTAATFSKLREGEPGLHEYVDGLGRHMIGYSEKVGDKPFYLISSMENSRIPPFWRNGFIFNLLSLCIGLVCLLFLSTLLWNRFRKPLQIFAEGTEKMLKGHYDYQIRQETINYLPSDLQQPIESFNRMVTTYKTNIRSLEHLASITSNIGFGLSVFDSSGSCKYMNPEALRMLGWSEGESINKRFYDFVKRRELKETPASGAEPFLQAPYTTEALLLRKNGTDFPVSLSVNPIDNHSKEGYVIAFRDITEEKRIEELLLRSEKLSVVGQLAAGLAHEIRNPLTSVKGFMQLLQSGVQPANLSEFTSIIMAELNRVEMIVSEFIILSKPHMMKMSATNLTLLMKKALVSLETEAVKHNVAVHAEYPDGGNLFPCEVQQMLHAFIHLIENGIEAMPYGGKLTIVMTSDPDFIFIRISDEGAGIDRELLSKLGEPFYTTKTDGIGLGLLVSIKIIEMHRGIVSIESKVGKGTDVFIKLPLHTNNAATPPGMSP